MSTLQQLVPSKYASSIIRSSKYSLQEVDDDEDDLCITIEEGFHNQENLQLSSVEEEEDPTSQSIFMKYDQGTPLSLSLPPIINDTSSLTLNIIPHLNPPSLPPPKHHFISASLPGSTTASPRAGLLPTHHMKNSGKKWSINQQSHDHGSSSSLPIHPMISRQQTFGVESHLLRSKSCGEGRASGPSDLFDLFSRKLSSPLEENDDDDDEVYRQYKHDHNVVSDGDSKKKKKKKKKANKDQYYNKPNKKKNYHLKFLKCTSALCLFLPAAFGRGKAVRSGGGPRRSKDSRGDKAAAIVSGERNVVISRTVSLEKFECGSWSSSAIVNDDDHIDDHDHQHHDQSSTHHQHQLYFDLPLELIQNYGGNDHANNFPVTTAFVFDRADSLKVKGKGKGKGALMIMKNKISSSSSSSSRTSTSAPAKKSHDQSSSRLQVRFSTSSGGSSQASCITPRLRKARDDFNAFLQAQNAS